VLDKRCQTSDWRRRPLSAAQERYAALDVEVLVRLRDLL
ncbi:MAG: ribonuclease D, partial [Myxococcales bacterium]|nr:ribonuclease D [Myxococcales bacterium]